MPWGGEGGARELLGVQTVRAALRGVASRGERSGQRLGGKFIAETALISGFFGLGHEPSLKCRDFRARNSLSL